MIETLLNDEWEYIGKQIGKENWQFSKAYWHQIVDLFGENGDKLLWIE